MKVLTFFAAVICIAIILSLSNVSAICIEPHKCDCPCLLSTATNTSGKKDTDCNCPVCPKPVCNCRPCQNTPIRDIAVAAPVPAAASPAILPILIGQIVSLAFGIQAKKFENEELIHADLFYLRQFDTTNLIDRIMSHNWTENHECLIELNAIKNGLKNREEWAIRVVDSWGNFPVGLRNGNVCDTGSFSECFHIKRNGTSYPTRYCIGQLFGKIGSSISIGICLPANCKIHHLESIVNDVLDINVSVKIPEDLCQLEESATDWKRIDIVTIGLFGVVMFMMMMNTGYDIFCTVYNQNKFPPLIVFSIYTNGKKLFACKNFGPSSGTIQCLEGIRVISTMWIVLVHTFTGYRSLTRDRVAHFEYIKSYYSMIPLTPIAVDTFLAISGLLMSYKMFKLIKKNGKLDILSLYWHRYLRLTPLLGVCVLVTVTLYRFFGSGPFWRKAAASKIDPCKDYWWSTLLYVQNYVNRSEMCIQPTWYLSVDMQLFIISPLLVYLVHRFKKSALIAMVTSLLFCFGYTLTVYINNNLMLFMQSDYDKVYYTTHIRFPSWLIGFIAGYILFEFPIGSISISKKLNLCGWMFSLIAMPAILFGNYQFYQVIPTSTALEYGLYDTLSRNVWSIAICYIIFACAHNNGGPINEFLSLPMWQPLSRLSYSIYLVHGIIIGITMGSLKIPPYFSGISAFQNFISIFVLSVFVSIPLVLAFELPIDAIVKLTSSFKNDERLKR